MDKIKSIIEIGIKDKMQSEIDNYQIQLEKLSNEKNVANIYSMIVEIYGNSLPQRKIAKEYLESVLTDDFFKLADIKFEPNSVVFYKDGYEVKFPMSRGRYIDIIDMNISEAPYYSPIYNDWHIELKELIETYLSKKSFSNLKKLSNHYKRQGKNIIAKFILYYETHKECNKDKLTKLIYNIDDENKRKIEHDRNIEEYNRSKEQSIQFAFSLESLKVFNDAGWDITLKERNRYAQNWKLNYQTKEKYT